MSNPNTSTSNKAFLNECFGFNPKEKMHLEKSKALEDKKLKLWYVTKYVGLVGLFSGIGLHFMIKVRSPAGDALRMILRATNPQYRMKHNFAIGMVAFSFVGMTYVCSRFWADVHHNPYSLGLIANVDEVLKIDDINKL